MTTAQGEVRARRPQQHEALMQEMQNEAKFPTYRDILLFAAAVGFHQQRRVSFTASSGDPIRYEVLARILRGNGRGLGLMSSCVAGE
ncbi:hypothetical protein [Mycobacterium sp. CnD-18-1]|uniref:hypothetical protein n=1 Tax=Mycobacterium sp. CnD-18-1 TaxID=2917744 RepID=UPI001EF19DA8|nr:hypothetical protein [Mycobacterium sp. CnD-18-1]MCG7611530.1 hypothetical protein [Mycobacterium sp. CnD-18-1]